MSETNQALALLVGPPANSNEEGLSRFMHDSALVVLFQYIGKCELQRLLHFMINAYPDVLQRAMATKPARKQLCLGKQEGLGDMLAKLVIRRFGLSYKLPTSRAIACAMDFTRPVCRGPGHDGAGCELRLAYDNQVSTAAQRVWGEAGYQMCSPCFLHRYGAYFIAKAKIDKDQTSRAKYHNSVALYNGAGLPTLMVRREYLFLPWLDAIVHFMGGVSPYTGRFVETRKDALRLCRAVNKTLVPYEGEGRATLPNIAFYKENIPVHMQQSLSQHQAQD